jgi:hypothetical protein
MNKKLNLDKIIFQWKDVEYTIRNRSYEESLKMVREFGYKEPKWYAPWTWWNNSVIIE